jgi:hypothetical protein
MIFAHHAFASSGIISGIGLDSQKTIGSVFIDAIWVRSMILGWLTPIKTSAFLIQSVSVHDS